MKLSICNFPNFHSLFYETQLHPATSKTTQNSQNSRNHKLRDWDENNMKMENIKRSGNCMLLREVRGKWHNNKRIP